MKKFLKQKKAGRRRGGDVPSTQYSNATGASVIAMRRTTIGHFPRVVQFFPDELDCWASTLINCTNSTAVGSVFSFKLNGPFNLFGPRYNNAGAFSVNVPAGAVYLLSNNSVTGAGAPYSTSTVMQQEVEIEAVMNPSQGVGCRVLMFPSTSLSTAGMSYTQAVEQNGAVYVDIPALQSVPVVIKGIYNINSVMGVSRAEVLNNYGYGQLPGSDPVEVCYLHFLVNAVDASTSWSGNFIVRFRTHFRLRRQNLYLSSAPS